MNDVRYNGRSHKDIKGKLRIKEWERPILPETSDRIEELEGVDGFKFIKGDLIKREISITFKARFDNEDERIAVLNDLTDWLFVDDLKKLEFSDEPGVYYMAKLLDPDDLKPQYFSATFTIDFICLPLKFGEIRSESDTNIKLGFDFTNNGTYQSPPVIKLDVSSDAEEFIVTLNGVEIKYMSESTPITSLDDIVIDCENREFWVNEELKVVDVYGHFPDVVKGENEIKCNVSANMNIEWQELYI